MRVGFSLHLRLSPFFSLFNQFPYSEMEVTTILGWISFSFFGGELFFCQIAVVLFLRVWLHPLVHPHRPCLFPSISFIMTTQGLVTCNCAFTLAFTTAPFIIHCTRRFYGVTECSFSMCNAVWCNHDMVYELYFIYICC